jgi:hypothetical protein
MVSEIAGAAVSVFLLNIFAAKAGNSRVDSGFRRNDPISPAATAPPE